MSQAEKLKSVITNEFLTTDAQGRTVFSPWRSLGKGYVLPDAARRRQVRRFLAWFYLVPLLYIVAAPRPAWACSIVLLALLFYAGGCRWLVRGMETVREPTGFREHCAAYLRCAGLPLLLFGFAVFFGLAWGSLFLLSRGDRVMGIFGTVVFGVLANFYGYLITLKITDKLRGDRSGD